MGTIQHSLLEGDELHTPFHYDVATYAEMIALTGMEAPDLCFITGDGGSPYIYNGTSWVAMSGPRTWVRETLNDLQSLNEAEGL